MSLIVNVPVCPASEGKPGVAKSMTMVGTSARQTVAAPLNWNVAGRVVVVPGRVVVVVPEIVVVVTPVDVVVEPGIVVVGPVVDVGLVVVVVVDGVLVVVVVVPQFGVNSTVAVAV
jgi:hypothetical protein